jgi:DNA-binding beta-propeller fold protein YncE
MIEFAGASHPMGTMRPRLIEFEETSAVKKNQLRDHSVVGLIRSVFLLTVTVSVIAALAGCAAAPKEIEVQVDQPLVWPAPPSEPVIRYLREFSSEKEFADQKKSNWKDALLGEDDSKFWALTTPYSVHVDAQGRVLVSDTNLPGLAVFDFEKQEFSMIGMQDPGMLNQPIASASDRSGRLYVTDGRGQKVAVYDASGAFLKNLGESGEFERPVGVAVDDARERVYVADTLKHHIAVFDFEGRRLPSIGERGVEPGQFNFPSNLAVDGDGRLYVTDSMNFRVQVFEPDSEQVTTIGEQGTAFGQFSRPKGVAVDSDGNIYVADAAFNNVQMFSRDGALLMFFGAGGSAEGSFYLPAGLTVDAQDRVYVADQGNKRIQVFQYLGKPELEPAEIKANNSDK